MPLLRLLRRAMTRRFKLLLVSLRRRALCWIANRAGEALICVVGVASLAGLLADEVRRVARLMDRVAWARSARE